MKPRVLIPLALLLVAACEGASVTGPPALERSSAAGLTATPSTGATADVRGAPGGKAGPGYYMCTRVDTVPLVIDGRRYWEILRKCDGPAHPSLPPTLPPAVPALEPSGAERGPNAHGAVLAPRWAEARDQ